MIEAKKEKESKEAKERNKQIKRKSKRNCNYKDNKAVKANSNKAKDYQRRITIISAKYSRMLSVLLQQSVRFLRCLKERQTPTSFSDAAARTMSPLPPIAEPCGAEGRLRQMIGNSVFSPYCMHVLLLSPCAFCLLF